MAHHFVWGMTSSRRRAEQLRSPQGPPSLLSRGGSGRSMPPTPAIGDADLERGWGGGGDAARRVPSPAMMKMTHCRSLKEDGHTSRSQRLRVEHGLFFRCRAACESKRCSVRELNVLDAARGCLSPDQTGGRGAGGAWGGTAGAKNTVHFFYPLAIATSHPEKMSTLRWQPELVCGRVRPRRLSCREI